jgi:D-arabinose 1-dehydrogenase-like Zn-dependent alcohol dehydrogenase
MCAGLTTFSALRNSGARPGDVVAVLGLGGLGTLGVRHAAKVGFRRNRVRAGFHHRFKGYRLERHGSPG